jgi:hypothetical protein
MQIGVGGGPCGSAGDEYDSLRRYLQNPALGPHDPTTAVELAALVLVKDKGAPTGKPIDAYWAYARAYNGSGPAAAAYADRVLADAHAYQGAGTLILRAVSPIPTVTSTPSPARRGHRRATTRASTTTRSRSSRSGRSARGRSSTSARGGAVV